MTQIFNSHNTFLTIIFFGLLILLSVLTIFYFIMRIKQKKEDEARLNSDAKESIYFEEEKQATPFPQKKTDIKPVFLGERGPGIEELSVLADQLKKFECFSEFRNLQEAEAEIFDNLLSTAITAIYELNWEKAKKYLEEAAKIIPDDPEINAKLAIVCYELGDMASSEKYYHIAERSDPLAAKIFRRHLAFRG